MRENVTGNMPCVMDMHFKGMIHCGDIVAEALQLLLKERLPLKIAQVNNFYKRHYSRVESESTKYFRKYRPIKCSAGKLVKN